MIKLNARKELATTALETYMATLTRKRTKEQNLLIVELLDKDIAEVKAAINSIQDAK